MMRELRFSAFIGSLCLASGAHADEGELYVDAAAALEAAWLRHPLAAEPSLPDLSNSVAVVPRFGSGLRYGLSNELRLRLGLAAAGASNVVTDRIAAGGVVGTLVTGTFVEVAVPLSIAWRFDSGGDVTIVGSIEIAPLVALWLSSALTDPQKPDATGLPSRLPVDMADAFTPGLGARASVGFEARVFGDVAITVAPYVGASWAGMPALHIGLTLNPAIVVPLSPL